MECSNESQQKRQEGQTEAAQQTYDLAELEQKYFTAKL